MKRYIIVNSSKVVEISVATLRLWLAVYTGCRVNLYCICPAYLKVHTDTQRILSCPQIGSPEDKASSYDGYSFICVLGSFALKFMHPGNSKAIRVPQVLHLVSFMPSTWL